LGHLETAMQDRGYLSGQEMGWAFRLLRSNSLVWHYVVRGYLYSGHGLQGRPRSALCLSAEHAQFCGELPVNDVKTAFKFLSQEPSGR
ncbi:MAG: hypothetical protein ACREYE_32165, partial [Gammaproteobacteria bacterium]